MPFDNYHHIQNVKLFTNRYPNHNNNNVPNNRPKIEDYNSSESESNDSNSDESSSSDEFVILEDYTTLKSEVKNRHFSPNTLKSLSNNQKNGSLTVNHPLSLHKTKSLPMILERSDESSVSSQSTLDISEDDSTLADCSTSSSSVLANELNSTNSKETEILRESNSIENTNNIYHSVSQNQPISDEITNSINLTDKTLPALLCNNDFPMCDSLNNNQTTMCHNATLDTPSSTSITDLDVTHQLISVPEWTKINKPSSSLSQSTELIFNIKRTPRFPVKNNYNSIENQENTDLLKSDKFEYENLMENQQKKPPIAKKPTRNKEPITDLDDLLEINQHHNSNESLELSSDSTCKTSSEDNQQKSGSYFKKEMSKNYTKTDLKYPNKNLGNSNNRLYEKKQDQSKIDNNNKPKTNETIGLLSYQKDSPSKRSQELVGNVVKMDKTINRVTNNIVKIDNAIDKLSQFNKHFMSNLELMSDSELSSDFETQSIGAQTETIDHIYFNKPIEKNNKLPEITKKLPEISNNIKFNQKDNEQDSSSSNESSTEKETNSESEDSVAMKPSPVHQIIDKPIFKGRSSSPGYKSSPSKPIMDQNIAIKNLKSPPLSHQNSDLSSLPESSVCENPETRDVINQVKYFQRQIKKSAGLYKKPPNVEPPKKLVVEETNIKVRSPQRPIPKPRNSIDNTLTRRMSNSSSESSNYEFNSRTLSNSNNHTQISPSPGNSDSGSIISLNSNHFERRFQKGAGASARYNSKSKPGEKWGTGGSRMSQRAKMEDESGSLSGKASANKSPIKNYMNQSRSYNNLHLLNSINPEEKSKYGSLAALNKNYNSQNINNLCDIIRHNLNLNNHDKIRNIFNALIAENEHEKIDAIIDLFDEDERNILIELIPEAGYGSKDIESIFDMNLSRTDLLNHLRPGLSMSSLSDAYYQHTIDNDNIVYWRADIEELLPPPMKPPPKPMPTNLLKSAIISPESLIHVDNSVLEVMQLEPTTFTELVSFLTKDCSKDVEKVRAIFRWITTYDMRSVNFDPVAPSDTLIGVLRAIKCGQMSNNELFFRMCRYAGIHCQFISGYSKGAGYRPGMAIKDNRMFRNVWTAVYVAGAWRFVNCNWGARYLTSRHQEPPLTGTLLSRTSQSQLMENRHRCDEFYFLTDAKQHIFEHYPDKKRWQLLNRPITLDQFMALPIVKSPFFNANLSFKRNYAEVLQTKKGKVTVKINMPQAVGVTVKLENRADGTILRGLTLVRILDNQMIVVTASPSQPGKFYLSIYVNEDWKSEDNMEMACSFQVHCSEHNYDRLVTGRFPDVGVLGSTPAAQNLGIIANPGVDPFVLWEERSTLKLNIAIRPGLRVGQKMMSYDRSGQNSAPCDSYAFLQYQNQGRSQYHLRFPIEGFYCLTIYAGVDDHDLPDTEPMECIYRLLIDCKRAQERIPPFPRQTSRWVGFRLIEPLCQHLELNTVYRFRILATECSAISVVINDNKWIDLAMSRDGLWKEKINTGQELENLSVYGKFGSNEDDEFIKLLDYILIPKSNK